jgi:hypothetical protein
MRVVMTDENVIMECPDLDVCVSVAHNTVLIDDDFHMLGVAYKYIPD